MTATIASRIRMTQPSAPCGAGPFLPLGRTSLNFAISAMVASRLMTRLRFALVLMLAGCGRKKPMPDVFAETIAGWHRTGVREGLDATGPVRNAESSRAATYEGAGKLDARIYAFPSAA